MKVRASISGKGLAAVIMAAFLAVTLLPTSLPVRAEEGTAPDNIAAAEFDGSGQGYRAYREQYAAIPLGGIRTEAEPEEGTVLQLIGGREAALVPEGDSVTYRIRVERTGLYNLGLAYYPVEGKGLGIEFMIHIDGELPFREAGTCTLYRIWKDTAPPGALQDAGGNDLTPEQEEEPAYTEIYLQDNTGTFADPYLFYLPAGDHVITLSSSREPLALAAVWLENQTEPPSYEELKREYDAAGYQPADEPLQEIEAERPARKADPVLYGRSDRSSPLTTPVSTGAIKINIIGGSNWGTQGQWIEWTVNAPSSGLYRIALRGRQNLLSGAFVTRKLYVDGELPMQEFADIRIPYSMNWQTVEIPYDVYLEAGPHTLRLEATVGVLSDLVADVEEAVRQLNYAYRRIVMITGTSPDTYRDYQLPENIPEVFRVFEEQIAVLQNCDRELVEKTGKRGSMNGILQTLENQLDQFLQKPETIQKRLSTFKDNIGALGTWLVNIKQQPLELDKLYLCAPGEELPASDAGFFSKLVHEAKLFINSFLMDYSIIGGGVNAAERSIDVWVQGGRDQANILKDLLNNRFTPENGIGVNLKLVQGQLMAATASGQGPDVVLQLTNAEPVNYAVRGASVDLSRFEDFSQVSSRFRESALIPYTLEGGIYALPETQTFQVMFYRTDILEELGIQIPANWEEFFTAVGKLQRNNMTAGIQPPNSAAGNFLALSSMAMLLYQHGGELYIDGNTRSGLGSEAAEKAFSTWVSMYADYDLPTKYDPLTRFRSGEMPIVVEDFTFYNLLSVAAPEIRGLWSFVQVPGTIRENGETDHSVSSTGICCMMLSGCEDREAAWTFMKWWTDAPTQADYGREMENRLGVSARYPSANVEAFSQMPWSAAELKTLNQQWENVRAIPEVPGGYFTSRHLNNAFRRVLNDGDDPRETLLDYVKNIDKEIRTKRKEFGLTA